MANNVIVHYNGGFLPDILLLTQAPILYRYGVIDVTIIIIVYYYFNTLLTMYYIVFCFVMFGGFA